MKIFVSIIRQNPKLMFVQGFISGMTTLVRMTVVMSMIKPLHTTYLIKIYEVINMTFPILLTAKIFILILFVTVLPPLPTLQAPHYLYSAK